MLLDAATVEVGMSLPFRLIQITNRVYEFHDSDFRVQIIGEILC